MENLTKLHKIKNMLGEANIIFHRRYGKLIVINIIDEIIKVRTEDNEEQHFNIDDKFTSKIKSIMNYENNKLVFLNGYHLNIDQHGCVTGTDKLYGSKKNFEIIIPEGAVSIGENAFSKCYLERLPGQLMSQMTINLPDSIVYIGQGAFSGLEILKEINIPSNVKNISNNAFRECKGLTNIFLSDIEKIENSAFEKCSRLTEVTLPESVTEIGDYAFAYCINLRKINLPKGIKKLGKGVFYGCKSLEEINLPESIDSISETMFCGCRRLNKINIPRSVKQIWDYAFFLCTDLEEIKLPEDVTKIGLCAFVGCSSLNKINMPDIIDYLTIDQYVFDHCDSLKVIKTKHGLVSKDEYLKFIYNDDYVLQRIKTGNYKERDYIFSKL